MKEFDACQKKLSKAGVRLQVEVETQERRTIKEKMQRRKCANREQMKKILRI
jgi:hypothetical protein